MSFNETPPAGAHKRPGAALNKENCPSLDPIVGKAFIVGATCFALYTQRLVGKRFDVVIADEASQLTQLQAAAGMLAGAKYVFIGDHQQMPPIIAAEHPDPTHSESIFEYLFAFAPGTRLNTTYRLNEGLANFFSQRFYDGDLISHKSAASRSLNLAVPPSTFADILDPLCPSVFADLAHLNTKTSEPSEAHYIAEMVAELLACGTLPIEIAIVPLFVLSVVKSGGP
ncbi:hypothetical protein J4E00_26225 [Siccationidurans soli]|uniref:DNA2/NAM7 helicase helicase domain-containing protein n=1 Tax=Hymenobacter negativus TaxID=2795026 RepID=A0ABS3QMU1_9BACT|nr:AAA domain-containing protein [Hymenobacter negativus]MBO2012586.1 hypothetical protein [Hymenobacter negativus]